MRAFVDDTPSIVTSLRVDLFAYNRDLKQYHPNTITPFDNMMDVEHLVSGGGRPRSEFHASPDCSTGKRTSHRPTKGMTDSDPGSRNATPPAAIVFDLNETLLDTSALDPLFADAFGDKGVRRTWFAQAIQNAFTATFVGTYADYGEMQRAALEMTAKRRGVAIDPERARRILRGALALPAHGDVHAGLTRLREAGIRLAVLTNATAPALEAQLDNARLRPYFEAVLSADGVRRFKPAPETYGYVVDTLEIDPADAVFVAAHDWDITGAQKAGFRTAFVARHGSALNPLEVRPDTIVPDIRRLADELVGTGVTV